MKPSLQQQFRVSTGDENYPLLNDGDSRAKKEESEIQ